MMEAGDGVSTMDMMSQFMDVITTFKCKVCDFVCYKQEDLFDHVRNEHIQHSAVPNSSATDLDVNPEDSAELNVEDGGEGVDDPSTTSLLGLASLVDEGDGTETIPSSYIAGTNIQTVNIQRYVDGHATDQVVFLDSGGERTEVFTAKQASVPSKETFLCGHCQLHFSDIDQCKKHMAEVHELDIDDLAAEQTNLELDLNVATQSSGTADTGVTDAPVVDDSEANISTNKLTISEREERSDGKVSMSTQVVRKKVGRKSKAELLELARKENQVPDDSTDQYEQVMAVSTNNILESEGEEGEEEVVPMLDIEDDDTNAQITYVEIEVPEKRKRRAPKHLTDDYLVPKKTKYMTDSWRDGYREPKSSRVYRRKRASSPALKPIDYPFKCDRCRARFMLEENLLYHNLAHSEEKDKNGQSYFICNEEECKGDSVFKTLVWADFKQHAWKEHSIDLGMIPCDQCDYRATVRSKLAIHKQIHSSEKPYICDICHKGFKQQSQLKNHALLHVTGVDVKEKESMSGRHWFVQVECDTCKRTFANQKSLQCHIEAVHEKVKPFSCKFCGHKAARKAMMQLHMRTHTGEKPFKCELCEYTTGDHNSMRRHRMRHTGDKPYQCPHCSYACIQAVSLKLHLKSKHPGSDKCYSCYKCPYRSVNKTLFTNHLRDHEMGLIDESMLVPSTDYSQSQTEGAGSVSIKLGAIRDLTNGGSNSTQLICSALNAIAPTLTDDGEPLPENIETTIETILVQGGVKSHKVSFQIPATATKNAKTAEVIVQEQVTPQIRQMDTLQAAAIESQIPTGNMVMEDEATAGTTTTVLDLGDNSHLEQHQNITNVQTENTTAIEQLHEHVELAQSQNVAHLSSVPTVGS